MPAIRRNGSPHVIPFATRPLFAVDSPVGRGICGRNMDSKSAFAPTDIRRNYGRASFLSWWQDSPPRVLELNSSKRLTLAAGVRGSRRPPRRPHPGDPPRRPHHPNAPRHRRRQNQPRLRPRSSATSRPGWHETQRDGPEHSRLEHEQSRRSRPGNRWPRPWSCRATMMPKGAELSGSVTDVKQSGRVKGKAALAFHFDRLSARKDIYRIQNGAGDDRG